MDQISITQVDQFSIDKNIALFSFILTHEKSYRLFRSDLLFILALITCLRLFFPFEFQFTKTIVLPPIMNPLIDILNLEIFGQIKLLNILLIIWGIGIIVGLGIYIHNVLTVNKAENRILKNSKRIKMSELLNDFASPDYDVYISDSVPSPMVLGFKRNIDTRHFFYERRAFQYFKTRSTTPKTK